jgi:hypothetical protein
MYCNKTSTERSIPFEWMDITSFCKVDDTHPRESFNTRNMSRLSEAEMIQRQLLSQLQVNSHDLVT